MNSINLNSKLFSDDMYVELVKYSEKDLSIFLQLGFQIFKKSQVNLTINTGDNFSSKSIILGNNGEEYVENILSKDYIVKNVSKIKFNGDLIVSSKLSNKNRLNNNILVEVKNYSNSVPYSEIEKFKRDLKANDNISGGIFISLNTKIQNIEESFLFTSIISDIRNIPIIYLCSSDANLIRICVEIIWSHLESINNIENNQVIISGNIHKIYKKITKVSELLNNMSAFRITLNETKDIVQKQLSKLYEMLLSTELKIKNEIDSIYKYIDVEDKINYNYVSNEKLISDFINHINLVNENSLITCNDIHKKIILDIIIKLTTNKEIYLSSTEKTVVFKTKILNDYIPLMVISPLKTKTTILISIIGKDIDNIQIPIFSKYEDGWITFAIDKNILKNNNLENINKFLELYL